MSTLVAFDAAAAKPPAANAAAFDTRNGHLVIAFDEATPQNIDFAGTMPRSWGGGDVKVTLGWMAASATTGTVNWEVAFERNEAGGTDLDADSFAAAKSATAAAPATAGALAYTTITFTNAEIDGLQKGDRFRLRIGRDADDATNDTMAGAAQLVSVEIHDNTQGNASDDYVNVRHHGAAGNGTDDDQTALANAISIAAATGKPVYVPAGVYLHSGTLTLDGVTMFGDGEASELRATDQTQCRVQLAGTGAAVRRLKLTCPSASERKSDPISDLVHVAPGATRWRVEDCVFLVSPKTAVFVESATNGVIAGNYVDATLADGIHIMGSSHSIIVAHNQVGATGDDQIAVVSYNSIVRDITITGNRCTAGNSRGIVILGGERITVAGNTVKDAFWFGILVQSDGLFDTMPAKDVTIIGNVISDCTRQGTDARCIYVMGRASMRHQNVTIQGNACYNAKRNLLTVEFSDNVTVVGNTFRTNTVAAAVEFHNSSDVLFSKNVVADAYGHGLAVASTNGGVFVIDGNLFEDTNAQLDSFNDVIHVDGEGTIEALHITNNVHRDPAGRNPERLVEIWGTFPRAIVTGNYSATTTGILLPSNGQVQKYESGTSQRRIQAAAAPSTGTWAVGDRIENTAPTEQGSTGAKYVITGWVCIAAGTPGTWVPMRALTGN